MSEKKAVCPDCGANYPTFRYGNGCANCEYKHNPQYNQEDDQNVQEQEPATSVQVQEQEKPHQLSLKGF